MSSPRDPSGSSDDQPKESSKDFSALPSAIQKIVAAYADVLSQEGGNLYDWVDIEESVPVGLVNSIYGKYLKDKNKQDDKEVETKSIKSDEVVIRVTDSEQIKSWLVGNDLGEAVLFFLVPALKVEDSPLMGLQGFQNLFNIREKKYVPLLVSICHGKSRNELLQQLCEYREWELFTLFARYQDELALSIDNHHEILNYIHDVYSKSEMPDPIETKSDSKGDRKSESKNTNWPREKAIEELQRVFELVRAVKKAGIDIFAEPLPLSYGWDGYYQSAANRRKILYFQERLFNIRNCYGFIFRCAVDHCAASLMKDILQDPDFDLWFRETMSKCFKWAMKEVHVDIFELLVAKRQQISEREKNRVKEEKDYKPQDMQFHPSLLLPAFELSINTAKPFLQYFATEEGGFDSVVRFLCAKRLKGEPLVVERDVYFSAEEDKKATIIFLFDLDKAGFMSTNSFLDSSSASLFLKRFFSIPHQGILCTAILNYRKTKNSFSGEKQTDVENKFNEPAFEFSTYAERYSVKTMGQLCDKVPTFLSDDPEVRDFLVYGLMGYPVLEAELAKALVKQDKKNGKTLLHYVVQTESPFVIVRLLRLLFRHFSVEEFSKLFYIKDNSGMTLLHVAADSGDKDKMRFLHESINVYNASKLSYLSQFLLIVAKIARLMIVKPNAPKGTGFFSGLLSTKGDKEAEKKKATEEMKAKETKARELIDSVIREIESITHDAGVSAKSRLVALKTLIDNLKPDHPMKTILDKHSSEHEAEHKGDRKLSQS